MKETENNQQHLKIEVKMKMNTQYHNLLDFQNSGTNLKMVVAVNVIFFEITKY